MPFTELCRVHGIAERNFYRWCKRYGELKVPEVRRLRERVLRERRTAHRRGGRQCASCPPQGSRSVLPVVPSVPALLVCLRASSAQRRGHCGGHQGGA